MYKGACLNPQLARIFAETGHTDTICVTDAGFRFRRDRKG